MPHQKLLGKRGVYYETAGPYNTAVSGFLAGSQLTEPANRQPEESIAILRSARESGDDIGEVTLGQLRGALLRPG